jgi:hypothetical protein
MALSPPGKVEAIILIGDTVSGEGQKAPIYIIGRAQKKSIVRTWCLAMNIPLRTENRKNIYENILKFKTNMMRRSKKPRTYHEKAYKISREFPFKLDCLIRVLPT